ncbi:hypothetical protein ACFJIW_14795 [Tahibacter sp. UC22_41]|uniref:hypothetical protein n=1 Tax=Tahibacter sp. UC22_41 TaxID=3350178 RepID=UPI0036DCA159
MRVDVPPVAIDVGENDLTTAPTDVDVTARFALDPRYPTPLQVPAGMVLFKLLSEVPVVPTTLTVIVHET